MRILLSTKPSSARRSRPPIYSGTAALSGARRMGRRMAGAQDASDFHSALARHLHRSGDAAGVASPLFGHYPKTGHTANRQALISHDCRTRGPRLCPRCCRPAFATCRPASSRRGRAHRNRLPPPGRWLPDENMRQTRDEAGPEAAEIAAQALAQEFPAVSWSVIDLAGGQLLHRPARWLPRSLAIALAVSLLSTLACCSCRSPSAGSQIGTAASASGRAASAGVGAKGTDAAASENLPASAFTSATAPGDDCAERNALLAAAPKWSKAEKSEMEYLLMSRPRRPPIVRRPAA